MFSDLCGGANKVLPSARRIVEDCAIIYFVFRPSCDFINHLNFNVFIEFTPSFNSLPLELLCSMLSSTSYFFTHNISSWLVKVQPHRHYLTLHSARSFFLSSPINRIVLRKVDQQAYQFLGRYLLVRGYENDAAERIRGIVQKAADVRVIFFMGNNTQANIATEFGVCHPSIEKGVRDDGVSRACRVVRVELVFVLLFLRRLLFVA